MLVERRASALGQSDTEGEVLDSRSFAHPAYVDRLSGAKDPEATCETCATSDGDARLRISAHAEFAGRRHAALDWSPTCFDRWFAAVRCAQCPQLFPGPS